MVTVAVNRVPLGRETESFLDHLDPKMRILPNTAGCYDAEHAIRTARLAREALETNWIKLEVIGDQVTLLPDNEQTLEAAKVLAKEGFIVLPYFTDDLIMAKKLLDAGCPAVMPLAAPIGSGMGVQNPSNLRIMREQLPDAVIIVDAGVGVPSDAAIAMELGADAILMNTAIAEARDAAIAAGITINGLPILEVEPFLEEFYRDNVIGGPNAFLIAAKSFEEFGEAILKKLVTEIAGGPADPLRVART